MFRRPKVQSNVQTKVERRTRALRAKLARGLSPTWQVSPQIARTLAETPAEARVCDLGAGGRRVREDVFAIDVAPGPGVDLVADAHAVPLPDARFDLLIATGMLNLCRDPRRVMAEMRRLLRPGGRLHVEVGLFQPYTPEPEDYWRFTLPGLRTLATEHGFEEVRSGAHMGPFAALSSNTVVLASRLAAGEGLARKLVRGGVQAGLAWVKYLDAFVPEHVRDEGSYVYGIYYVGRAV